MKKQREKVYTLPENLSSPSTDSSYEEETPSEFYTHETDGSEGDADNQVFPEDEDYLLFVKEELVSKGSKETIEEEVRALVYERHSLSKKYLLNPEDDIKVYKKVAVKIGVFVD